MNNTTKTILLAIMLSTIVIPLSLMSNADAVEKTGRDIIIQPQEKIISPDLLRMNEIVYDLESDSLTEEERSELIKEAELLREKAKSEYTVDTIKAERVFAAKQDMRNAMNNEINISDIGNIREIVTAHGVGAGDQFIVYVDPKYFESATLPKIFESLRQEVGTDIDITIKSRGLAVPTCSQTGECNPVEGGVEIRDSDDIDCSVGFQAKDGTTEGFITAGHCFSNNEDVFQPYDHWLWDWQVGTVDGNALVDETTCDCLFVDTDESVEDEIYSNINADQVGTITFNDWMTTKGQSSGSFTGQIKDVSIDITYPGSIDVLDQFEVNTAAIGGDSGGPTYEAGAQFPDLMGIIVANDSPTNPTVSYHSKASNMDDELTGVSWDFT